MFSKLFKYIGRATNDNKDYYTSKSVRKFYTGSEFIRSYMRECYEYCGNLEYGSCDEGCPPDPDLKPIHTFEVISNIDSNVFLECFYSLVDEYGLYEKFEKHNIEMRTNKGRCSQLRYVVNLLDSRGKYMPVSLLGSKKETEVYHDKKYISVPFSMIISFAFYSLNRIKFNSDNFTSNYILLIKELLTSSPYKEEVQDNWAFYALFPYFIFPNIIILPDYGSNNHVSFMTFKNGHARSINKQKIFWSIYYFIKEKFPQKLSCDNYYLDYLYCVEERDSRDQAMIICEALEKYHNVRVSDLIIKYAVLFPKNISYNILVKNLPKVEFSGRDFNREFNYLVHYGNTQVIDLLNQYGIRYDDKSLSFSLSYIEIFKYILDNDLLAYPVDQYNWRGLIEELKENGESKQFIDYLIEKHQDILDVMGYYTPENKEAFINNYKVVSMII